MSIVWIDRILVEATADGWADDAELIRGVGHDLRRLSLASMPPRVLGAATAFRAAWAGHAAESDQIATGMAEALRGICADLSVTDAEVAEVMESLDGSLGPSR